MRRGRTLLINEVSDLPKAREFLNSKAIRSEQTKKTYHIAVSHLQTFLKKGEYKDYDVETILVPLLDKKINVYSLFRNFVDYLVNRQDQYFGGKKLRPESTILYVAGVRSYFEFHDVEISSRQFAKKVTLPRKHRSEPEPIDAEDIANMLKACNNKRLRAFILLLATTGMRANEALSLKNSDINFEESPTKIHVRAEITKTKTERYIYTTDEATKYLKIFIDSKYRNYEWNPNHLLFKMQNNDEEHKGMLYSRVSTHFTRLLEEIGMDKRKDGDGKQRRKISFHSFRRFVKTTISNQRLQDYSEWLLGHHSSISAKYYNTKERVRKDLYKDLMKYLTFLDFATVESVGRDFESKLKERDQEITSLTEEIQQLSERESSIKTAGENIEAQLKTNQEQIDYLKDMAVTKEDEIDLLRQEVDQAKRMYLKAMAGNVVMESDLDSKGRTKRKIIKNKN